MEDLCLLDPSYGGGRRTCGLADAERGQNLQRSHHTAAFLAARRPGSFDLIFLDPPYGGKILNDALYDIERFDILSKDGIIVCESAVEDQIVTGLAVGREYRYGTIKITIVRNDQEDGTDQ